MSRPLEYYLHHMRASASSPNAWEAGFARSILRQSKKPSWTPSSKQLATMNGLIAEALNETDCEVLEDFDPAEAGPCLPVGLKDGGGRHGKPTMGRDHRQRAVRKVEARSPAHCATRRK